MTKIEQLAARLKAMKPSDRLRVAAGLIDEGQHDMAESVIRTVTDELTLAKLLGRRP